MAELQVLVSAGSGFDEFTQPSGDLECTMKTGKDSSPPEALDQGLVYRYLLTAQGSCYCPGRVTLGPQVPPVIGTLLYGLNSRDCSSSNTADC